MDVPILCPCGQHWLPMYTSLPHTPPAVWSPSRSSLGGIPSRTPSLMLRAPGQSGHLLPEELPSVTSSFCHHCPTGAQWSPCPLSWHGLPSPQFLLPRVPMLQPVLLTVPTAVLWRHPTFHPTGLIWVAKFPEAREIVQSAQAQAQVLTSQVGHGHSKGFVSFL